MFKKSMITIVLMFASLASVQAAEIKIGIVDTQAILAKAPQAKSEFEKIQKQFKERQDELVALQKKGEDLKAKAERDQMTLTNNQKVDLSRELQELDAEFTLKKKFFQEDLKMAQNEVQQLVYNKINEAIKKVVDSEKFDLIITRDAVIYATPAVDITDKILAIVSNPAG